MRKEGEQGDYGRRGSVRRGVGGRSLPCGEVPVARGKTVRHPREKAEDKSDVLRVHRTAVCFANCMFCLYQDCSTALTYACEGEPRSRPTGKRARAFFDQATAAAPAAFDTGDAGFGVRLLAAASFVPHSHYNLLETHSNCDTKFNN